MTRGATLKLSILAACILISGCNRDITLEAPGVDVALTVTATPPVGSPAQPVTIAAQVLNLGTTPRACSNGCSFPAPGMDFRIIDPDGKEVYLTEPGTRPACPDSILTFPPREVLRGVFTFDGTLFGSTGARVVPQEGTYTFIVSFASLRDITSPEFDVVESRTTFRWSAQ